MSCHRIETFYLMDIEFENITRISNNVHRISKLRRFRQQILHRTDDFAVKVTEYSVLECLKSWNKPELIVSFARLLNLYQLNEVNPDYMALYVLYFGQYESLVILARRVRHWECAKIQFAVNMIISLKNNDYVTFSKCYQMASDNQKLVLRDSIDSFRSKVLQTLAKAYKSFPLILVQKYLLGADYSFDYPVINGQVKFR
jgi:hypothetical protein